MTITAELFDGTKLEFPDGTDPAVIARVAKEQTMARKNTDPRTISPEQRAANVAANAGRQSQIDAAGLVQVRDPGFAVSAMVGGLDGLTFGFADELEGVAAAKRSAVKDVLSGNFSGITDRAGSQYAGARDNFRSTLEDAAAARPKTVMSAQIAGGVVPALLTGGTGAGAAIAAKLPATMAGKIFSGTVIGAGAGAIEGAVSGAGRATEGNRIAGAKSGAVTGAVMGGIVGGALPPAVAGIKNGLEYFKGKDQSVIAKVLGISPRAAEVVRRSVEADDFTAAREAINRAGPDAMLADAGSATGQLLDTAMTASPRALSTSRKAIEARAAAAQGRLAVTFDSVLGTPEGVKGASRGIASRTADIRTRAYKDAYSQPIDYAGGKGAAIEDVLSRVAPDDLKRAVSEANAAMRDAGVKNKQIMATVADNGDVSFSEMPNVQQLDELKKALDGIAQKETDAITGRISGAGLRARRQASDLRDALGEAVGPYKMAVRLGGDKIQEQNALDAGRKIVTMPFEDFQQTFAKPSKEALLAAKKGFRTYIENAMSTVKRTIGDDNIDARQAMRPVIDLSSDDVRKKMKLILSPDQYKKISGAIDEATMHLGLRASVATNSKTAVRQFGKQAVDDVTAPGLAEMFQNGEARKGIQGIVQALTGSGPKIMAERQQAIFYEIADALTRARGKNAKDALIVMQKAIAGQPLKRIEAERIARIAGATLGGAGYQTGTRYLER